MRRHYCNCLKKSCSCKKLSSEKAPYLSRNRLTWVVFSVTIFASCYLLWLGLSFLREGSYLLPSEGKRNLISVKNGSEAWYRIDLFKRELLILFLLFFRWGSHVFMALFSSVVCPSIWCGLSSIAHHISHIMRSWFCYTCKMIHPDVFFIVLKFWFSRPLRV